MEKAPPLTKSNVHTTEDIVERMLVAESEYDKLRARFNILIDWILIEPS